MSRDRFVMFSTGMLIALLLGMALSGALAPAGSDTADGRPVVAIKRDPDLSSSRATYVPDHRAQNNPDAWDYLDPGGAGTVQGIESAIKVFARPPGTVSEAGRSILLDDAGDF
jgi:hypothetical protein